MKVKTLLAPLLIVSIIFVIIWLVYPAYTNGVDGFKEQRAKLAKEQTKLAGISEKSINIDNLRSQLQSDSENRGAIFSYIPEDAKEEEIINSLNSLATDAGVLPINISVEKSKAVVAEVATMEGTTGTTAPTTDVSGMAIDPSLPVIPKAVPMETDAKYSVVGSYEQIKTLLGKLYRLGRVNGINSLIIEKAGKDKETGNALQAEFVLNFDYLKKPIVIDMENPIFSMSSFDMKVASEIRNKNNVGVSVPNIDQIGRSNPFLP
jgi:Tfp pilus assembly protein PilO